MNRFKLMTFFILIFGFCSISFAKEPNREQVNRAVILAEAFKARDHQVVRQYLNKDSNYFDLHYYDRDSDRNLFLLMLEYLRPSDFNQEDYELDNDWKKFISHFTKSNEAISFISKDSKENLGTIIGRNGTVWLLDKLHSEIDKSIFNQKISSPNKEGSISIHYALQAKNLKLVKRLIELDVELNLGDRHGITPIYLHLANYKAMVEAGEIDSWSSLFEILLSKSKIDQPIKLDPTKYYPLVIHLGAANGNLEVYKKLVEKTNDVFGYFPLKNGAARNSLSIAIENKSEEIMDYIFLKLQEVYEKNAGSRIYSQNLQIKNHQGKNLIHLATESEFLKAINIMSDKKFHAFIDVNAEDLNGEKAIDYTFKRVRKPILIIEGLVLHPNMNLGLPLKNGKDLFTNLTQFEVVNAIKVYLQKFVPKWNGKDRNNNPIFLKLLSLKNYDIYEKVIQHFDELDVDLTDSLGANIVHYLVFYAGSRPYLSRLAKSKPELFTNEDQNGQHALFRAAVASKELLFDKAEDKEDPIDILLNLGIEFDLEAKERRKGRNLAHLAVANVNNALFDFLMEKKPELFLVQDNDKSTPLHYAADRGAANFIHKILEIKDGDFSKQDELRKYPIHYAFESEDSDSIAEFIRADQMLDVLDPEGKVIIDYLIMNEDWEGLVDEYIEKRPASIQDGLLKALEIEDFIYIDYFLEAGADPNKKIERGEFKGLYPIMIPLKLNLKKTLDFFVSGYDPELPDEPSPRNKMNYDILDHQGRSIITYAMMTQDIEIIKLVKKWNIPIHPGKKVEGENVYLSHLLINTAAFREWKYGDDKEIAETHLFLKELYSIPGINPNINDRNGESWSMTALKLNNPFVFSEAIKKWPNLLDESTDNVRAVDLVIKLQAWRVITDGIQFGFHPNQKFKINNNRHVEVLKKVFDYWGYSDSRPYLELINLGMDTDLILEAVDGLFEDDQLLESLEIYIDNYLKECPRIHLEKNQNYRLSKEDHRIYPAKDSSACFSPSMWENLSEQEDFKGHLFKIR